MRYAPRSRQVRQGARHLVHALVSRLESTEAAQHADALARDADGAIGHSGVPSRSPNRRETTTTSAMTPAATSAHHHSTSPKRAATKARPTVV